MSFVASWFGGGKKSTPATPPPAPAVPTTSQAEDTAKAKIKARKRRTTNTILTSPLGIEDEATVQSPTLLGMGQGKTTLG